MEKIVGQVSVNGVETFGWFDSAGCFVVADVSGDHRSRVHPHEFRDGVVPEAYARLMRENVAKSVASHLAFPAVTVDF